jgi:WD40 repeat protein
VTAGSEGIEIWNLRNKAIVGRPGLHKGAVRTVAYSFEKSGIFVSGGEDGQLIFYLPGNNQKATNAHKGGVFATAFSKDSSAVVSAGADGLVKVWDAKSQSEQRALTGHTKYVLSVGLSNDLRYLVSGGADRSVRVWSLSNAKAIHVLEGHEKDIEGVSFLGTSDLIVSVSEDKTMRVWDAVHGTQLLTAVFYSNGDFVVYNSKGEFTGTEGVAKRLEIGADGPPRALSVAEQRRLFKAEGFQAGKLVAR